MFLESRVREITATKAEAREAIIRCIRDFADSELASGLEEEIRDAAHAIEQRDSKALAAAMKRNGDAACQLSLEDQDLENVVLDDDGIFKCFASFVFHHIASSFADRCLMLRAGFEIDTSPRTSTAVNAALDVGITIDPEADLNDDDTLAALLVHPRSAVRSADLMAEYLRARDLKAYGLLRGREQEAMNLLQGADESARESIMDQFGSVYGFMLDRPGLIYEYIQQDDDLLCEFSEDDPNYYGVPWRPAIETYRNEIVRRIQDGDTEPFVGHEFDSMIAAVKLAKTLTEHAAAGATESRNRVRNHSGI